MEERKSNGPIPWPPSNDRKLQLSLNDAKFLFEQAEKVLKETIDISNTIVSKTTTLITIATGFLTAMIAFAIGKWDNNLCLFLSPVTITCLVSIVCYIPLCILLFIVLRTHKYGVVGTKPIELFDNRFFEDSIPPSERLRVFYIAEVIEYQRKIEDNEKINDKRWAQFNICLVGVAITPIFVGITFVVTTLFL